MVQTSPSAADLLERLRAQPGGAQLLESAPERAFLVGGAVRDLLLGRRPQELDVVVEGDDASFGRAAARLAGALASRVGSRASVLEHERFGTAIVEWGEDTQGAWDAEGKGSGKGSGKSRAHVEDAIRSALSEASAGVVPTG